MSKVYKGNVMDWEGLEKRRFVRAKFPCKIIVYPPCEHVIISHTEDISAGGVRVIISDNLDISSLVGLEIYLKEKPIACKGRVVWVVEKANSASDKSSMFDTGIEFYEINEKDKETIGKLVETIVTGKR